MRTVEGFQLGLLMCQKASLPVPELKHSFMLLVIGIMSWVSLCCCYNTGNVLGVTSAL